MDIHSEEFYVYLDKLMSYPVGSSKRYAQELKELLTRIDIIIDFIKAENYNKFTWEI